MQRVGFTEMLRYIQVQAQNISGKIWKKAVIWIFPVTLMKEQDATGISCSEETQMPGQQALTSDICRALACESMEFLRK